MDALTVRDADPERDAAACAAIYAPHVEVSPTSFEEIAPTTGELAGRIERISETHPWLVAEHEEDLLGFAYACRHRERAAYRWTTDVSIYIGGEHRHREVGTTLYGALLDRLRQQRFRLACAGITLPNEASVKLHEHLGFTPIGVFRRVGWKAGSWRDVGWWQLDLGQTDERHPSEPLAPGAR